MKNLTVVSLAILLAACATTYMPYSSFNGGYTESRLDVNVFQVSFVANDMTTSQQAADYAMLRSAELTLVNGYKYFQVIGSSDQLTHHSGGYTTTNPYTGQNQFHAVSSTSPSTKNTIACFKEKPEDTFVYDAKFVLNSIKTKYKIKNKRIHPLALI